MKIIKIFLIIFVLILYTINPVFAELTLTLKDSPVLFDFGSYDPGGNNYSLPEKGVNDGFIVSCRNSGPADGWALTVDNTGLTEENDSMLTIPSTAFLTLPVYAGYWNIAQSKWFGTTDTAELQDNILFHTFQDFYGGIEVYRSAPGDPDSLHDATKGDTEVTILFGLNVPGNTKPGTYKCNIVFTLTQ